MEIIELSTDKAVAFLGKIVKVKYLLSHLQRCIDGGSVQSHKVLISCKLNGTPHNGKIITFDERDRVEFQEAAKVISMELLNTCIKEGTQSQADYPLCYGEDYVSKFKVLGQCIRLPYLFQTTLGKTMRWQKMKLSNKYDCTYNRFKPEELDMINDGIHQIALQIASIKIVPLAKSKEIIV